MIQPENQYYQSEVSYDGYSESFTFWIIGNSPDIEGDVKNQYKKLRGSRGQGWDKKKYKFIDCYPIEK